MNGLLQLEGVTMRFGGLVALDHLDIDIAAGSIHALIGPNGAGKSTLLNCISRFCTPQEGDIRFNGASLMDRQPHHIVGLGIARSFQNIEQAHQMTVLENVLIGLSAKTGNYIPFLPGKARQQAEAQALEKATQILDQLELLPFQHSLAGELDFGRQKMLDFARALASEPKMLLLDVPFGALDAFTREELWCILRDLWSAQRFNVVLVTHDLRESVFLADTVYVMSKSPGRFLVKREIDLPRPRDLELTYTPAFGDIVHELRGHIGAIRKT